MAQVLAAAEADAQRQSQAPSSEQQNHDDPQPLETELSNTEPSDQDTEHTENIFENDAQEPSKPAISPDAADAPAPNYEQASTKPTGAPPFWDTKQNGVPVNQEDLAFTLLTFGYTIPIGLEQIGISWSEEDREAWWTTWRLVGSQLGIVPELLPANITQCKVLYDILIERLAGSSKEGIALTNSLKDF